MFVDRIAPSGAITATFNTRQYEGQEEIADNHAEVLEYLVRTTPGRDSVSGPPSAALDLINARRAKLAEIDAAYAGAVAAGVPWSDKVLQIDDVSRANIAGQATRALGVVMTANALIWPQNFAWRMADNSYLPLTAEGMLDMAQAASDRYGALRFVYGAKKDAAEAAATQQELDVIDPSTGWD